MGGGVRRWRAARRRWLITGWAVGFAPQTAATVYVDGKKVATLAAHMLDHIEIEVHSRQPPRQIHISGASGPDDPPPTSSFSVTELPP